MSKDEILALQPGRELDAIVAEKVMGFSRKKSPRDINGEFDGLDILVPTGIDHSKFNYPPKGEIALTYFVPTYSMELTQAWKVFCKFGYQAEVKYSGTDWYCNIMWGFNERGVGRWYCAEGRTAPEAICKAAILAILGVD